MSCGCQMDLCIYQGDDWAGQVTVLNAADGTPADLTGYTAQAQIRKAPADQAWWVAAEITCTVNPPNFISLQLTNQQTTLLTAIYYQWDLQIVSPAGLISTIMGGDVNVTLQVTREPGVTPPWDAAVISQRHWPAVYRYPAPPAPSVQWVRPVRLGRRVR